MNTENNQTIQISSETILEEPFYLGAEFWVGVAFVIVVFALFRPIKKALKSLLTRRIIRIKKELQEAENIKLEAQKLYSDYERKYLNIEKEDSDIIKEQKNVIEETKEKKIRELNFMLQRKENEVNRRIEQEFEQAGKEIRRKISEKTIEILKRIISSKLTKSEYNNLIDNSIKQIKEVLSNKDCIRR